MDGEAANLGRVGGGKKFTQEIGRQRSWIESGSGAEEGRWWSRFSGIMNDLNDPIMLLDRAISWVKKYEGNINQNGTDSLGKGHKLLQDMNIKSYD